MGYRMYDDVVKSAYVGNQTAKSVLMFLSMKVNDTDSGRKKAYPSVGTIAKATELSERSVQFALRNLVALGYLERSVIKDGRGHMTYYYFESMSKWPSPKAVVAFWRSDKCVPQRKPAARKLASVTELH